MRISKGKPIFIFILFMLFIIVNLTGHGTIKSVYGYYGTPFNYNYMNMVPFTYNNSAYGYTVFGFRPYVPQYYKSLFDPFSFGGIHNLFSSNVLGLYGMNPWGSGLYGIGGLGGLFGACPICNLGLNPFSFGINTLSTLALPYNNPFVAEQAGAWTGTWNLGFLFGTMIMNLTENPLTGSLSGTVQLIGNITFSGIFNVFGTGSTTFIQVNGQDPTISYAIVISGTLPTLTTMTGFYSIYKVGATSPLETGTFDLELVSAAVI